jgi:(p)ppGpp synthase/HD superfamily hydrolase
MHSYAQTNLQLYNQMLAMGYSELELLEINRAYQLVINLFSDLFRPNGKLFIAHLIGTASVLVKQQAPITVVSAGLLHAAYANGFFPDPRPGITEAKRQRVRQVVGADVEELVARYTSLRWTQEHIQILDNCFDSLNVQDKQIILIRIANELEDHLDRGMLYCSKDTSAKLNQTTIAALATKMGSATLGDELLQAVFDQTTSPPIPTQLRRSEKVSFMTHRVSSWRKIQLWGLRVVNYAVRAKNKVLRLYFQQLAPSESNSLVMNCFKADAMRSKKCQD